MRPTMSDAPYVAQAYARGRDAANAAASWAADGNTSAEHVARVLAMLAEGDPAADDYLPARPNLSGEWADDPTPLSLAREILGVYDTNDEAPMAHEESIADAFERGVTDYFGDACVRELRAWLPTTDEEG